MTQSTTDAPTAPATLPPPRVTRHDPEHLAMKVNARLEMLEVVFESTKAALGDPHLGELFDMNLLAVREDVEDLVEAIVAQGDPRVSGRRETMASAGRSR